MFAMNIEERQYIESLTDREIVDAILHRGPDEPGNDTTAGRLFVFIESCKTKL